MRFHCKQKHAVAIKSFLYFLCGECEMTWMWISSHLSVRLRGVHPRAAGRGVRVPQRQSFFQYAIRIIPNFFLYFDFVTFWILRRRVSR